MSLSVVSFLGSSGSMGTGIAATCQAFRHLLKGDEKNIRCGRAEQEGQEAGGQDFDRE